MDTFPSVDRAGREDCGNHGAQTLPGPRCYDRLGDGIGNLDPSVSLSSKFIRLFFGFGFGLRKQKKKRRKKNPITFMTKSFPELKILSLLSKCKVLEALT